MRLRPVEYDCSNEYSGEHTESRPVPWESVSRQSGGIMKQLFSLALAALAASAASAVADTYPSRPITIVVPFPAGGSTGALARILVEPLQAALGQSIIIENV